MTFLPIVERELRVATRRRSTYWLRVIAAGIALVIGSALLLLTLVPFAGPMPGSAMFGALTWMSLAAALCGGLFFTSDCLSEEKREGTLGFLFLTDLLYQIPWSPLVFLIRLKMLHHKCYQSLVIF